MFLFTLWCQVSNRDLLGIRPKTWKPPHGESHLPRFQYSTEYYWAKDPPNHSHIQKIGGAKLSGSHILLICLICLCKDYSAQNSKGIPLRASNKGSNKVSDFRFEPTPIRNGDRGYWKRSLNDTITVLIVSLEFYFVEIIGTE